jgi:hypothetical protein
MLELMVACTDTTTFRFDSATFWTVASVQWPGSRRVVPQGRLAPAGGAGGALAALACDRQRQPVPDRGDPRVQAGGFGVVTVPGTISLRPSPTSWFLC